MTMQIHCSACDKQSRNCKDWYKHLISDAHQEIAKVAFRSCSTEVALRTIVCWDFKGTVDGLMLINYFGEFGLVQDIFLKKSIEEDGVTACIVLMDSEQLLKNCITEFRYPKREDTQEIKTVIRQIGRRLDMEHAQIEQVVPVSTEQEEIKSPITPQKQPLETVSLPSPPNQWNNQYSPTEDFKNVFMTMCSPYGTPENVELRMKIIWTSFLIDFFDHIFDKGFSLKVQTAKLLYSPFDWNKIENIEINDGLPYSFELAEDAKNQDLVIIKVKSLRRKGARDDQNNKESNSSSNSNSLEPPKKLKLKTRLTRILESFSDDVDITDYKEEPQSSVAVSEPYFFGAPKNRIALQEAFGKIPSGLRKAIVQKRTVSGSSSSLVERKRFKDALISLELDKLLIVNPINLMESATKMLIIYNNLKKVPAEQFVKFNCTLIVDTTTPRALVTFTDLFEDNVNQLLVVDIFKTLDFHLMFQQYMMMRLCKFVFK